jgi:metal-responsive CopG/Arc/MetJ family transcriptional regulator
MLNMEPAVPSSAIRTALALPNDLLAAVDRAVRDGQASSRNAFIADALHHELAAMERDAIEAAFAALATDAEFQAEARALANEFATADAEALRLAEGAS